MGLVQLHDVPYLGNISISSLRSYQFRTISFVIALLWPGFAAAVGSGTAPTGTKICRCDLLA